jgi:putative membrane protein
MRWMFLPAAALAVLAGCSPANDRGTTGEAPGETGMASTDTMTGAGGTGAATGSAGATTPGMDASGVLSQLAAANKAEIKQAQAAAKKASTPAVKQYANQLVKDHKANSQKLQQVAKDAGVTLADTAGAQATSESESATMGELEGKTGKEFDRAFVAAQIDAHQQNIDKIRNQLLPAADQPAVRDYLQQTASAMEGHLASARQLQQDLGGSS